MHRRLGFERLLTVESVEFLLLLDPPLLLLPTYRFNCESARNFRRELVRLDHV